MQHQHGVKDCGLFVAAVYIALVYESTLTHEVGPISYALIYQSVWFITTYPFSLHLIPVLNTLMCGTGRKWLTLLCLIMPEDLSKDVI